jgi:Glycosyl transferase family 2
MWVPVYNEAHTIGRMLVEVTRALSTVLRQIIVVDDCSNDGTSEWLRQNLAHVEGAGRRMSLDDDGEVELTAEGPQSGGGFPRLLAPRHRSAHLRAAL